MPEYVLRLRVVSPEEMLSEETVLQKDLNNPFLGPGDRPEPYRTQYIAAARMKPVFEKVHITSSPFLVKTSRGRALVWRWWPQSVGIVLMRQGQGETWLLDDTVTFLKPHELSSVALDLTHIVLNPPSWAS